MFHLTSEEKVSQRLGSEIGQTRTLEVKNIKIGGAAVAQWIRSRLPSCRPGFESQAHHLRFFQIWKIWIVACWKDENKRKRRPGLAHFKKKHKIFYDSQMSIVDSNALKILLGF